MTEEELANSLRSAHTKLEHLRAELTEIEGRTWVINKSFLKRCFAIYGHNMVAALIIMIPVWIVMLVIVLAAGMLTAAAD